MRFCVAYLSPLLVSLVSVAGHRGDVYDFLWHIKAYCAHAEFDSEWLECERTADGKHLKVARSSKGGAFILPAIINNEMLGELQVYRSDTLVQRDAAKRTWTQVELDAPVRVLLQVLDTAAGVIEVATADAASFYQFANGRPVGPASYLVRDEATGFLHPIQQFAFFQERLDGNTLSELINRMNRDEVEAVVGLSQDILNGKLVSKQMAQRKFRNYALRRLSLVDAVTETALELWEAGLMHCDAHPRNVILLKSYAQDVAEIEELLGKEDYSEKVHLLPPLLRDWNRLAEQENLSSVGRNEIEYLTLDHQNMRYFDTGKMLELIPVLQEVKSAHPVDPDNRLLIPCSVYRGETTEDIEALVGGVAKDVLAVCSSVNLEIADKLRRLEAAFAPCRKSERCYAPSWVLFEDLGVLIRYRTEIMAFLELAALEVGAILDEAGCAWMRREFRRVSNWTKGAAGRTEWKAAIEIWATASDKVDETTLLEDDASVAVTQTDGPGVEALLYDYGERQLNDQATRGGGATTNDEAADNECRRIYQAWEKTARPRLRKRCSLSDMKAAAAEIRSVLRNTSSRIRSTFIPTTEERNQQSQMRQPRTPLAGGGRGSHLRRIRLADIEALESNAPTSSPIGPTDPPVFNVTRTRLAGFETYVDPESSSSGTRSITIETPKPRLARIRKEDIERLKESKQRRSNLTSLPSDAVSERQGRLASTETLTESKSPLRTKPIVDKRQRPDWIRAEDIEAWRKSQEHRYLDRDHR